ncbi:AfsR/SARP family transcriptional regulator [Streptomyces sp.]|uniref:AfsR/SARP family transcriptional regulator n=1 Tax=Streptomyces sp. TaxID=1931 RepID=UPI002F418704
MPADGTHELEFALLGPITAGRAGTPVVLGPRQRRVLLTRLLIAHGRPVSMDRLCEDLWAGNPPRGAVSAVHAHISRLRKVLEPEGGRGRCLTSEPVGYALIVPDQARDTVRFEYGTNRARELLARRRTDEARAAVDAALAMWRGPALAEAADHPFAVRETARLDELLLTARELQVAVLLSGGSYGAAVAAAHSLTADQPLRETAWDLLMRALYLAGRPAEAVRAYQRAHQSLMIELRLEPGLALRELRSAILRHDTRAVAGAYGGCWAGLAEAG